MDVQQSVEEIVKELQRLTVKKENARRKIALLGVKIHKLSEDKDILSSEVVELQTEKAKLVFNNEKIRNDLLKTIDEEKNRWRIKFQEESEQLNGIKGELDNKNKLMKVEQESLDEENKKILAENIENDEIIKELNFRKKNIEVQEDKVVRTKEKLENDRISLESRQSLVISKESKCAKLENEIDQRQSEISKKEHEIQVILDDMKSKSAIMQQSLKNIKARERVLSEGFLALKKAKERLKLWELRLEDRESVFKRNLSM